MVPDLVEIRLRELLSRARRVRHVVQRVVPVLELCVAGDSSRAFTVDIDGIYDPQSKSACRAFQCDRGLVADGIVGPQTWKACFG